MMDAAATQDDQLVRRVLGSFDVPAFVKRALRLEAEEESLLARLKLHRQKLLDPVRRAWVFLQALQPSQASIQSELEDPGDYSKILVVQHSIAAAPMTTSDHASPSRLLRRRLLHFVSTCQAFNERWRQVLAAWDLETINRMVENYNRYGLLERECAMSSARLAARGFTARKRWTPERLSEHFPLLPIPLLRYA